MHEEDWDMTTPRRLTVLEEIREYWSKVHQSSEESDCKVARSDAAGSLPRSSLADPPRSSPLRRPAAES